MKKIDAPFGEAMHHAAFGISFILIGLFCPPHLAANLLALIIGVNLAVRSVMNFNHRQRKWLEPLTQETIVQLKHGTVVFRGTNGRHSASRFTKVPET